MTVKFVYFDLGKVLVDFSVEKMLQQISDVAGVAPDVVDGVLFDGHLQRQYETGQITSRQFHEAFCEQTGTRPDYEAMRRAACEIFTLNAPMLPIIMQLLLCRVPIGILSNTCDAHWEYCTGRFPILSEGFAVHALSYRLGAVKPDPSIFEQAARLAGVAPDEIFFTDDLPQHIAGAKAAGFDAVQFTSAGQLAEEMRAREIRFNY